MKKKSAKNPNIISEKIKGFLLQENYSPLTEKELFSALNLTPEEEKLATKAITILLEKEEISIKKKRISLTKKQEPETVLGVLHAHPKGFGFVTPEHPLAGNQDIFIPKHLMHQAVDGDKVEVLINAKSFSPKGPEGSIVSVVERARSFIAGIVRSVDSNGNGTAFAPLLGANKPILVEATLKKKLKIGDRYLFTVKEWPEHDDPLRAEPLRFIGNISDASVDNKAAIFEYELPESFPANVIEEAKAFGDKVPLTEYEKRNDLTKMKVITIDPTTAKDFDDALSLTKDRNGNYHLGVHIADVAHYIPQGSFLDIVARERCNSTYLPGFCLPMLPEELSNHLCSLKPNVVRLTVSVFMDFDKEGTLTGYKIERTFIKSAKRFTYEEAFEVIEGRTKSPFSKELDLMVELCLLLKKKRTERGSIDFSLPDTVIELDDKGEPTGIKIVEYDISHQLVEEFMLKANETVAKHLSDLNLPLVFRIHEEPTGENFKEFCAMARSLGFTLPSDPTTKDLQKLFDDAKKQPFSAQLSVGFIRMMKMAFYSQENVGHFGLALEYYCHFTSPIRRYTDLIIQRLLFNEQKDVTLIKDVAEECSNKERVSMRAENSVKQLKKLRLLKKYLYEEPTKEYIATVTRIKPYGLFFEVPSIMIEGFIHISALEDDFFLFDEAKSILVGKYTKKIHKIGEFLPVRLDSVDLIELESNWSLPHSSKKKSNRNAHFRR